MSLLRSSPFDLQLADLVAAQVVSLNLIGQSLPSQENTSGAEIRTEPLKPLTQVERYNSGTTDTQITVTYSNLLDATLSGGSPVLSLNLYWDQGIGLWVSLTGSSPFYTLDQSYSVSLLQPGHDYNFKYRAINIFGVGEFSDISTIKAATNPDQIAAATTKIVISDVVITWPLPNSRGSPITAYAVSIISKTGVPVLESSNCIGATVLSQRTCTISLAELQALPYNLVQGDLVRVQVTATNAFGTS